MGTMMGFVLGYVLGTRAGEEGWQALVESWQTISSSEEMRGLVTGGLDVAGGFLRQGAGILAERLSQDERGSGLRAA